MPGSLGHELQDAKTFASWVLKIVVISIFFCLASTYQQLFNKIVILFDYRVLII